VDFWSEAEICGVFKGLKIARECGFCKLEFYVDSRVVVSNHEYGKGGSTSLLINIGVKLGSSNMSYFRETKFCVDALANLTCDGSSFLIIYERCSVYISSYILIDYVGVITPRLIKH